MMKTIFLLLLIVGMTITGRSQDGFFYSASGDPVLAKEQQEVISSFDLFEGEQPLELEIISNFRDIADGKFKDDYQAAKLIFYWSDKIEERRTIRVKPRGHSRRRICHMPPLKLDFSDIDAAHLRGLEKIKMVSYCKKGKLFEQYLFKEFLVYQLYRLFTPISFRARLMKMKYVDTGQKDKEYEGYAFIIEEVDRLEQRLQAVEVENVTLYADATDYEHVNMLSVFQFMIGNLDWSVPSLHNIKLLRKQEGEDSVLYCVPYDFDYSGIVDAHYAKPPTKLHLSSVRDRLFRGSCRTEAEFRAAFEVFQTAKPEVYNRIKAFEKLSKRDRKSMLSYLDSFYEIISDEKLVDKYFLDDCR